MNIIDILTNYHPIKVKLNKNFKLDESFDPGTILKIINIKDDGDGCYKVNVISSFEDMEHNISVAENNWLNWETNEFTANYYECNIHEKQPNGDYNSTIFVMSTDDCFDPYENTPNPYFKFAEWLGENYIRLHEVWVHRYNNQLDEKNYKTTEDLYVWWEKNLKNG